MTSPGTYLTAEEVAEIVRLDADSVRRWAQKGLIPAVKLPGGQWRFPSEAVEAILRGDSSASVTS